MAVVDPLWAKQYSSNSSRRVNHHVLNAHQFNLQVITHRPLSQNYSGVYISATVIFNIYLQNFGIHISIPAQRPST